MRERERDGDAALPPSKAARRTQSQAQARAARPPPPARIPCCCRLSPAFLRPLTRLPTGLQLQLPSLVEGLEDFFSSEPEKLDLAPHRANAASHLPPLHHPGQATPQPAAPHPVQLPQQAQQHMSPINRSGIEGLQAFSSQLQAAGSLLTHADISQELRGRHAEVFLPLSPPLPSPPRTRRLLRPFRIRRPNLNQLVAPFVVAGPSCLVWPSPCALMFLPPLFSAAPRGCPALDVLNALPNRWARRC